MKIKVKRVVVATFDETECSTVLDGLLAVANREVADASNPDSIRAQVMYDKLRSAWRTS